MSADDPLSPAEIAFRKLLEPVKNPHSGHLELSREYREWAALQRIGWERANVVWFYGFKDGKQVWGRNRPNPEIAARTDGRRMNRAQFLAELAEKRK